MCIQSVEVQRKRGKAAAVCSGAGHVTNQSMGGRTGARGRSVTSAGDPAGGRTDPCTVQGERLPLASAIPARHSVASVSLHHQHLQHRQHPQQHHRHRQLHLQQRHRRRWPSPASREGATPPEEPYPCPAVGRRVRVHFLPAGHVTTRLMLLLIMVLTAVIGPAAAGTCWLRRFEPPGKCNQLFARNVTRESCCAAGSGAKGFSEKDITDVGIFFINAFNDGMECSSCLDTCDRVKCASNKRCAMRRNRPKCICSLTCGGGRSPKRNNRPQRMHQQQQQQLLQQQKQQKQQKEQAQQRQEQLQPHFHQQNIKVINLSESQRNRRQYFADERRQPRPRQLRYTGAEGGRRVREGTAPRRSVKKSSLVSEPRSPPSSQRRGASAKHDAPDSDKERADGRQHNLLASVTLASSSIGNRDGSGARSSSVSSNSSEGSSSNSSSGNSRSSTSSSTSTSKASTHRPRARPRPSPPPAPPAANWTGGERIVLPQDPLEPESPNGLALTRQRGSKRSKGSKGHRAATPSEAPAPAPGATGRHHRKVFPANHTAATGATHRNQSMNGRDESPHKSTVAPFAAFGKPKLLRVPKPRGAGDGSRHNRTGPGPVRVPRREPQYLDDVFLLDNLHHQPHRRNPHQRGPGAPVDDFFGNEIMQHSSFYNPVCGNDGKTYKTECQLKKRACRQELTSLMVAYKGHCQTSCKFVKCQDGKRCIEDQNATPHCVSCGGAECRPDRSPRSVVCGTDGITYPSICELKRQACLTGRAIPLAYRGRCVEAATCETIKCKDRQHCLTDLKTHKPRCVSCSYKCPRMKRQQGPGKAYRNTKNNPYGEQSVKLCGTNNRTYHSWCHMQKDSCNTGFYIDVQHSGSCAFGR